jgi:hypothetical protein
MYFTSEAHREFEIEMRQKPCFQFGGGPMAASRSGYDRVDEAVPYIRIIQTFFNEIDSPALTQRANRVLRGRSGYSHFFIDSSHEKRFWNAIRRRKLSLTPSDLAATYLRASDMRIWCKTADADYDCRCISQAARDFYNDTLSITLTELLDSTQTSEKVLWLLLHAFILRRYGMRLLTTNDRRRHAG